MDIKELELGHVFQDGEIKRLFKDIYGGVSWPGERPGFAVVIGMDKRHHFDSHDIYLLDEYESFDMGQLVQKCGLLDFRYHPTCWIGDRTNDAADYLIREMNDWYSRRYKEWSFSLSSTPMLKMEKLYQCILHKLKELRSEKCRQLFLKNSKILDYMSEIDLREIAKLELGEYPAIEALAFAVIEMRNKGRKSEMTLEDIHQMQLECGFIEEIPTIHPFAEKW